MKIARLASTLIVLGLAVSTVHGDVKTRQRTQLKFEGMMGRVMNMATGGMADGLTNTVAVKGARKAEINDRSGRIIDLAEERIYELDVRKKEYRVITFAQLREQWKKAQADAEKAAKDMPAEQRQDPSQAGAQIEVTVDVKETGETKSILGHQAKQVLLVVTALEKGKTLEESGGIVMTNDLWIAPRVAALDEVSQFDLKFFKAVYGSEMAAAAQSMASLLAMYPSLQQVAKQMEERTRALNGTTLMSTSKVETVKSAEQMKQAPSSGGGGLGGALARRIGGNRSSEPRSLLMTSMSETQSIDTSASDADVAIPAGFKEKK